MTMFRTILNMAFLSLCAAHANAAGPTRQCVYLFPSDAEPSREGFVRVIN